MAKNLVTVVAKDSSFLKQVTHIFPENLASSGISFVHPGADLSFAKMIVTDGSDESVYDEDVPTFVIADAFPRHVRESASVRFYKRGTFSPEVFAKDVSEWAEIVGALENASECAEKARATTEACNEKIESYESNLKMASLLQKKVMSPKELRDFDMSVCYQPISMISGDLLVVEEMESKVFVVIGDVTDHGYLAGLYGASLNSLVKSYLALTSRFEANLEGLVRYVQYASSFYQPEGYGVLRQKTSATMLFCEIDKEKRTARFVSCGHGNEMPVAIDENGDASVVNAGHMLPVVGDFTVIPPLGAVSIPFAPGCGLIFYTDGITEIFRDPQKRDIADEYSTERLLMSVSHETKKEHWTAHAVVQGIVRDAESYSISLDYLDDSKKGVVSGVADDVTILALKWRDNLFYKQADAEKIGR